MLLKMKNNEMAITEHLAELRKTVIIIAAAIIVCSAAMLLLSGRILSLMTEGSGYNFIYTSPEMMAAQQLKIAVICGVVVSLPVSLAALWKFVCPAMKNNEKRLISVLLTFGLALFFLGVLFAYKIIFPVMIRFFRTIETDAVAAYISIAEYINFLITVCLIFGIAFELPIVMTFLVKTEIVQRSFFRRIRKYAAV
ncbi:MAG: twin-arginine translocase subunit TatC, partial [Candidatus Ornithomonoglobus sp.]